MLDAPVAPTSCSVLSTDGTARLLRFHGEEPAAPGQLPLLLVPSLINRWYVMDLREGSSLVQALVNGGIDTFCLDWGTPEDEDRYLSWDMVLARLHRTVRRVKRITGAARVGILGYCMGGTLSGIYTALHPDDVACLINLAGPFDFAHAGPLGDMVDESFFDPDAIADAGNVKPLQMQAGFTALRPTLEIAKWIRYADTMHSEKARESFAALNKWSGDNIPFPGEAYRTYIRELYQQNRLVAGTHRVAGETVDLANIKCPVLTIVADRDNICPPRAATGLNEACGSNDATVLSVPGGHVGAVVGSRAARDMYPHTVDWLRTRLRGVTVLPQPKPTQTQSPSPS